MEKLSCLLCGRLSDEIFCKDCHDKGWDQYHVIQTFLKDYPGITTIEVCRELSVSLAFIKGLVFAGYLNLHIPKPETVDKLSSGFRSAKTK